VIPAPETIDGVMQTADRAWRVEVVRRGATTSYRIVHGDDVIDWLPEVSDVEHVLTGAGITLQALQPAPPHTPAGEAAPRRRPPRTPAAG
jgi:hypothetical protein